MMLALISRDDVLNPPLDGQITVFEAVAEAEGEGETTAPAAPAVAPALPGDGSLFAVTLTTESADGALFGFTV